jgi:hypothetical protein
MKLISRIKYIKYINKYSSMKKHYNKVQIYMIQLVLKYCPNEFLYVFKNKLYTVYSKKKR